MLQEIDHGIMVASKYPTQHVQAPKNVCCFLLLPERVQTDLMSRFAIYLSNIYLILNQYIGHVFYYITSIPTRLKEHPQEDQDVINMFIMLQWTPNGQARPHLWLLPFRFVSCL